MKVIWTLKTAVNTLRSNNDMNSMAARTFLDLQIPDLR